MPELRDLLEMRVAAPVDFSFDGESLLVLSNLTGTMQLYRVPRGGGDLEQLTDQAEPITGFRLPGLDRMVLRMDEGGNERHQLYLLEIAPGAEPEPLLVEPDFMHVASLPNRDGSLVAYASDRRNGVDFDVYVRTPEAGAEDRRVFDLGGWCEPGGFSPDGRYLAVLRLTKRSGDNDLYLVDLETGETRLLSAHDDEAFFGPPEWLDERTFYAATSTGRDTTAIARYNLDTHRWETVIESEWDLQCSVDPTGRHLVTIANEDGYTRVELRDARTLESRGEIAMPGRGVIPEAFDRVFPSGLVWADDGTAFAYQFTSAVEAGDVWIHDGESGETTRVTDSPSAVDRAELVEPSLHRFASFDGESVPVYLYEPQGSSARRWS